MGGDTSALIPAFSPKRRRIIVRRPAKLGELEVRTVCGLTIRDTADCQSALLMQTGTSRFVGSKNQLSVGWGLRPGQAHSADSALVSAHSERCRDAPPRASPSGGVG